VHFTVIRKQRFEYLKDRLFLASVLLYLLNRFLFKPLAIGQTDFWSSYFNDLICIPFCLPFVLLLTRLVKFRNHNRPPDFFELSFYLLLWSYYFEFFAPSFGKYFNYPVFDPWDIVCYASGTIVAGLYWNFEFVYHTRPGIRHSLLNLKLLWRKRHSERAQRVEESIF
jgi:hypothetical protein